MVTALALRVACVPYFKMFRALIDHFSNLKLHHLLRNCRHYDPGQIAQASEGAAIAGASLDARPGPTIEYMQERN